MSWLGNVFKSIVDIHKVGAGAIVPGLGNYFNTQDTNEANKKLVEQQNASNVALWQMQTEYNTPINQMKRLEAAGLNPNLAYGQIAESRMASAPQMQSATMQPARFNTSTLADFAQIMNMQETNKLIRAQRDEVAARAASVREDVRYKQYENEQYLGSGVTKTDNSLLRLMPRAGELFKYLFYSNPDDRTAMKRRWEIEQKGGN